MACQGPPKATSQRTSYHRPMRQYPTQGHARCHDLGKDPNTIGAACLTCAIQFLSKSLRKGRFISACSRRSHRLGGGPLSKTAPTLKDYSSHQKISPEIKKSDRSYDKYCPKPLRDSAFGALSNVGTFRLARKVLILAQSGTTEIHSMRIVQRSLYFHWSYYNDRLIDSDISQYCALPYGHLPDSDIFNRTDRPVAPILVKIVLMASE